jgi:hypothetical protein
MLGGTDLKNTGNVILEIEKRIGDSFDVTFRKLLSDKKEVMLIFIDHICDINSINQQMINPIVNRKNIKFEDMINYSLIPNFNVEKTMDVNEAILKILTGYCVIIFENSNEIFFCKSNVQLKREITIPPNESVFKGPREGFNEDISTNLALLRERIVNEDLVLEQFLIGTMSNTMVVLTYIKGIAPESLISEVQNKLSNTQVEYILDSNYIGEKFQNPRTIFETVGYTEKPDIVASQLFQGKVAVLVNGTPSTLTLPYFFIENFQTADDYYVNRYVASITRFTKIFSFLTGLLLPGLFIALTTYHFSFIPIQFLQRLSSSRSGVTFPTYLELLFMMFFFYVSKEAAIRLPKTIGSSLSIVAGLVLGQTTVEAGLASQITVVIAGIYAVATFVNPKITDAISVWSVFLLIIVTISGYPGFIMGLFIFIIHIASLDSCGYPYTFPFITVKEYHFKDIFWVGNIHKISKKLLEEGDQK